MINLLHQLLFQTSWNTTSWFTFNLGWEFKGSLGVRESLILRQNIKIYAKVQYNSMWITESNWVELLVEILNFNTYFKFNP